MWMNLSREKLTHLYRRMVTIRSFEEKIQDLYARGFILGLAHLCIGEEGVAVGVCENLTCEEYIRDTASYTSKAKHILMRTPNGTFILYPKE
jgi:TPP-dependent pyruvate/acetoin dehydrogenase alpha subunit